MPNNSKSRNVLIIDDEEMIRNIVTRIMDIKGHHTTEAKTGQEAIDLITNSDNNFDYAILDLTMPGMSGYEVFEKIKEITSDLKIIISSGYISDDESEKFLSNGAYAILEKPFKLEELNELIK